MDKLRIVSAAGFAGEGISQGLARGLLVWYGNCNLTGEGMGIGSVAFRTGECTFFSRSWTDYQETGIFRRTFTLDTRMTWCLRGRPSDLLTRWIEAGISVYMRLPRFQNYILLQVLPLRTLLGIHPVFETITPRGMVTFTYQVDGHHVDVWVESHILAGPGDTLCLLNELSAAWFTHGWDGKQPVSPPPGWEDVKPEILPVSLVDPVHGILFTLDVPSIIPPGPCSIHRGREFTGDLCWAGFCIELGSPEGCQGFSEVRYRIGFSREVYA